MVSQPTKKKEESQPEPVRLPVGVSQLRASRMGKRISKEAEEKKVEAVAQSGVRRRELQDGAYRMVFNNQTNLHNKVNLRDTSTDPNNLFGDANLARAL